MIVKLNVGGSLFLTNRETLVDSGVNMLSAMIRHENPAQQVDGYYFIDRDPHIFRWILNYLRGSKVLPRSGSTEISLLREEAEFFALDGLVTQIQHILCPSFTKGDNVVVRGHKYTIMSVEENGYKMTRLGKIYPIPASENVEQTQLEIGDVVMAYHVPSNKRQPGTCMAIRGKNCTIKFDQFGQFDCKDSGVRF